MPSVMALWREYIGLYTPIANTGFYPSNKSISILCEKGLMSRQINEGMRIKQHVKSAVECGTSFSMLSGNLESGCCAQVSSSTHHMTTVRNSEAILK
ncbi:hypothetical protein AVEN_41367-1 [Araneus ventricosus]|uniref:Uncharacterized protein n=1 Tax=Araneus ventricosus TaxID=182803 RepID=A0A4Y2PRR7_ARAVE|nr:hypothetical protein AVEN_41367-1 [Araneus ventricosus]